MFRSQTTSSNISVTKIDLKNIKKQLLEQQKADKAAAEKMQLQQAHESHEHNMFNEAMSDVVPLKHDKVHHDSSKPKAKRREIIEQADFEIIDPLSDELEIEEIDPEDTLSFCRTGIQKSVFKKLRSGAYRISDELDLHGATVKQAKQILVYYLQEAVQFENCCIRIVHGKGHRSGNNKPVLKTHVNHWLSEHERVLAFHSAKPKDGGTGAVYVLLKR